MVQFALLAALSHSGQTAASQDVDVWFCPYIEVTGHTPFDDAPGRGAYDARDAFGGTFGSMPHEQGHVVFQDDSGGPSTPDFIEWNTKQPVVINRLVFSWQDDTPGNDWRNLARFWIYGRRSTSDNWDVLWQENTPSRVGRRTVEKKIAAHQYQFFRAEFMRSAASNITAVGPRICALEAYGYTVASNQAGR
ncbi:MAG TPA: hypothetical protein VG820_11970 [Fimbriimonadaceae bacterium]|nr:hypothetical protein [Fimbriimonadaceae bacterium]